jgi:hypothetical protein
MQNIIFIIAAWRNIRIEDVGGQNYSQSSNRKARDMGVQTTEKKQRIISELGQ